MRGENAMKLLSKNNVLSLYNLDEKTLNFFLDEGIPYLKIGNELRFIQEEAEKWIADYKPKQLRLEEQFLDEKGRTLKEYVDTDIILDFLQIKKEKLYRLCRNGMPFVKVGLKRFFHQMDIVSYFRVGASFEVVEDSQPQNVSTVVSHVHAENFQLQSIPLLVVDGSHSTSPKKIGAGVVLRENGISTSFRFDLDISTKRSNISEFFAISKAMNIIKEKKYTDAIIVTDQKDVVQILKTKEIPKYGWLRTMNHKIVMEEFTSLFEELKDIVRFEYLDILPNKDKNPIYRSAHTLSRNYKKNEGFSNSNSATYLPTSENQTLNSEKGILVIEHVESENNYHVYDVLIKNKTKRIRTAAHNQVLGALLLAKQFVNSHNISFDLHIKGFKRFTQVLDNMFNKPKKNIPQSFRDTISYLKAKTNFKMDDSLDTYLKAKKIELVA